MARTNRRDFIENEKHKAKKLVRTLVRTKFSMMAEDILNDVIPDIDDAVDKSLADGTQWELDIPGLITEAIGVALPALALEEAK